MRMLEEQNKKRRMENRDSGDDISEVYGYDHSSPNHTGLKPRVFTIPFEPDPIDPRRIVDLEEQAKMHAQVEHPIIKAHNVDVSRVNGIPFGHACYIHHKAWLSFAFRKSGALTGKDITSRARAPTARREARTQAPRHLSF